MLENLVATIPTTEVGTRLIEGDKELFRQQFNRADFGFTHRLATHPLFELPALIDLAKTMPVGSLMIDAGDIRVNQRLDQIPTPELPVEELLDRIANNNAWIVIRNASRDPEYAAIIDQVLAEFQELSGGALPKKMLTRGIEIFITSPHRITPYHIDRGCKLFLQVRGAKTMHIFDRYDRDVLPEEELEQFWTVSNSAAVYKEQYQNRAHTYDLKPGMGLHIPVNAAHWVQNSDDVSVSLSFYFRYLDSTLANIYRSNYLLRKLGMKPVPPGRSRFLDVVKGSGIGPVFDMARKLKLKRLIMGDRR